MGVRERVPDKIYLPALDQWLISRSNKTRFITKPNPFFRYHKYPLNIYLIISLHLGSYKQFCFLPPRPTQPEQFFSGSTRFFSRFYIHTTARASQSVLKTRRNLSPSIKHVDKQHRREGEHLCDTSLTRLWCSFSVISHRSAFFLCRNVSLSSCNRLRRTVFLPFKRRAPAAKG